MFRQTPELFVFWCLCLTNEDVILFSDEETLNTNICPLFSSCFPPESHSNLHINRLVCLSLSYCPFLLHHQHVLCLLMDKSVFFLLQHQNMKTRLFRHNECLCSRLSASLCDSDNRPGLKSHEAEAMKCFYMKNYFNDFLYR